MHRSALTLSAMDGSLSIAYGFSYMGPPATFGLSGQLLEDSLCLELCKFLLKYEQRYALSFCREVLQFPSQKEVNQQAGRKV